MGKLGLGYEFMAFARGYSSSIFFTQEKAAHSRLYLNRYIDGYTQHFMNYMSEYKKDSGGDKQDRQRFAFILVFFLFWRDNLQNCNAFFYISWYKEEKEEDKDSVKNKVYC